PGVYVPENTTLPIADGEVSIPSGFTVLGGSASSSAVTGGGIVASKVSNVAVRCLSIKNPPMYALNFDSVDHAVVDDVHAVSAPYINIRVFGSGNRITNNSVNSPNSRWYGIDVSGDGNLIAGNYVTGLNGS